LSAGIVCAVLAVPLASGAATEDKSVQQAEKAAAQREQKLEAARQRLDEAAREVAELSMRISEAAMPGMLRGFGRVTSRAVLGLNIGNGREDKRKDGVEILSVSPGAAAADAGLKAGDVIVEIKGVALKQDAKQTPREKLLDALHGIEPGEQVALRYVRDGKSATTAVIAQASDHFVHFPFEMPPPPGAVGAPHPFVFTRADGLLGSAELTPLTPKLGQYFGTDKGLLVVRAPADSRLQLEEGDVIIDLDGRVPANTGHALRILSSYQAGEKLQLNVMRMKKPITLDITIPENARAPRTERPRFNGVMQGDVVPGAPPPPPLLELPRDRASRDRASRDGV